MYKKILVGEAIQEGSKLLEELRRKRLKIQAAFWRQDESGYWEMVVVSPSVDRRGPHTVYTKIREGLEAIGAEQLQLRDIHPVSPSQHRYAEIWSRRLKPKKRTPRPVTVPVVWPYEEYFYAV